MTLQRRLTRLESIVGSPEEQLGSIRFVTSDEEEAAARKSLLAKGTDPERILIIRHAGPERINLGQLMDRIAEHGHRIYDDHRRKSR